MRRRKAPGAARACPSAMHPQRSCAHQQRQGEGDEGARGQAPPAGCKAEGHDRWRRQTLQVCSPWGRGRTRRRRCCHPELPCLQGATGDPARLESVCVRAGAQARPARGQRLARGVRVAQGLWDLASWRRNPRPPAQAASPGAGCSLVPTMQVEGGPQAPPCMVSAGRRAGSAAARLRADWQPCIIIASGIPLPPARPGCLPGLEVTLLACGSVRLQGKRHE